MSELLDNQVDIENENLRIEILGFAQALVEVAMKMQKKTTATQKISERKDFIKLYQKTSGTVQ